MAGPTLPDFRDCFSELIVDLWNNDKACRVLTDWLKDVGVEGEKESEGEENEEEMEANVLEEDEPEASQEIPPVQSYHLPDSSGDNHCEDPLLGGMRSSDSDSE